MIVLDASAMLAFLQGEAGADRVEASLPEGVASAANWSETAQKVRSRGGDWSIASTLLRAYGVEVEPVTIEDAERAAQLWSTNPQLSLGDRLCLALSLRLGVPALTADRAWGSSELIQQLR